MADSPKDKIKYGLLKFIDISGFKVLDPPVRLIFGEDPQKQVRDIGRFMLLPIIFVLLCILTWHLIAPTHKTKSGAVPTPGGVIAAYGENKRFDEREEEKEDDFTVQGAEREERIAAVKARLVELEKESVRLNEVAAATEKEAKGEMDAVTSPITERMSALRDASRKEKKERAEAMTALAKRIAAKEADPSELLALVQKDRQANDAAKEELRVLKDRLEEILSDPPAKIKASQLAANKVADEVQHYKKRLDYLTSGNRELKGQELMAKQKEAEEKLLTAGDPKVAVREAKKVVSSQEKVESTAEQEYPRTATIFWQTKRSIATVIVGFLLAAAVAIPLGIMCGLNKVVMACLTPIISIFRPVSPVVWLLIFQIIIGAFFPDPATHPLFVFLNQPEWLGFIPNPVAFLQTNPAMIFSACTVAMCALWPALVNTALGVSAIDKDHMNVARVLKLGFWSRLFKIVIPSSLPLVFAGLRISLGVGWMVLIAAEALSSSDGLGKFVWDEYQNGSSQSFANIILACFIVGIIGFFLDRVMIILQRLVSFDDGSATA